MTPCRHLRRHAMEGSESSSCDECGKILPRLRDDNAVIGKVDMVNHPPHYKSNVTCPGCGHEIQCIDVIRHIKDGRLFTAMKYLWRVALGGGKSDDCEDIDKGIWYLNDWLKHDVDGAGET